MAGAALAEGSTFGGRYEIIRCVGQGGMGAVYEVLHRETRRRRALKVLLPVLSNDAAARARFSQEASITADIDSDHLVEVYDAGIDAQTKCPYIVMELLRGETMGERLGRKQRLSPGHTVEVLRQVSYALELTHARGIVHRDLKPDNIFLARREDGSIRVKVLDFGIAKVLEDAGPTRNTVNIGTPLYMAPEQLDGGRLSPQTDLYALTHIAYELMTGESYWEDEVRRAPSTMVLLRWMEKGLPEAPSARAARLGVQLTPAFDAWFYRGVARDPAARFANARQLVEAFSQVVGTPLADVEAGRLSLTGLLPAGLTASPTSVREPSAVVTDLPTQPRPLRRTGEAVVTPVGRSGRGGWPAWALALIGAGAAAILVSVVLFFVFRSPPGVASSRSTAPTESAAAATASSPVTVAPERSTTTSVAAASDDAPSTTAAGSTKGSAARVPTTGRSSARCKRDPSRCR
ncbi:MAG: serine/threonine-protein kinase [Polyangiaceae bacterium]